MDYAALPPEINSGRMYAGPGAGPLVAAAAAWDGLAAELNIAAASYRSTVSELTGGPWVGPSSTTMAAAATPYVSWMSGTAAQVEQTASQLKSAIAAYEAAFTATVPPPEIEVNRALLAALVATNLLGQNTPAIMATEAQYAEMWAQDAAAMFSYAGASAAATKLLAFASPPQATNPTGAANQAAAVTQATTSAAAPSAQSALTAVPNVLQGLSAAGAVNPAASLNPITWLENLLGLPIPANLNTLTTNIGNWTLVLSGFLFTASGITPLMGGLYGLALPTATAAAAGDVVPGAGLGALVDSYGPEGGPMSAALNGPDVSAGVGEAATVGKLSVPHGWTSSPAIRLAGSASPLSSAAADGVPAAGAAEPGFFGGIPPVGSLVNAPRGEQTTRTKSDKGQKVVAALPGEQHADERPAARPAPVQPARKHVASALSEREREELDKLRKEIADVAMERDAAARLIKEAML
ncbi:PPE family protein [Mycobacterium sp. HUMS_1102779]|uniref:PPE family protein n=1 Tax=Mycobacterium sp. HUMS_1102779 TaxID=3383487 RepID=UPI003899F63A